MTWLVVLQALCRTRELVMRTNRKHEEILEDKVFFFEKENIYAVLERNLLILYYKL